MTVALRLMLSALFCAVLLKSSASAVPIDPAVRQKIEQLLAAHEQNRARIKTLRMSGTFQKAEEWGGKPQKVRELATFDFFQRDQQRRLDTHYLIQLGLDDVPMDTQGHTVRRIFQPTHRVQMITEFPQRAGVGPGLGDNWHSSMCTAWLEATRFPVGIPTDIHFIRHAMDFKKGAHDAFRFDVKADPAHPANLRVLEIESFEGDEYHFTNRWTFDLQRGAEIVAAHVAGSYPDGKPWYDVNARYDVHEVAMGVWRVTGVEATKMESGKTTYSATITINTHTAVANAAPIADETFTPKGIGIPPAMIPAIEQSIAAEKSRAARTPATTRAAF